MYNTRSTNIIYSRQHEITRAELSAEGMPIMSKKNKNSKWDSEELFLPEENPIPADTTEPIFVKEVADRKETQNDRDKKGTRLSSLDALRGFNMFFIMGGSVLIVALCHFITAVQTKPDMEYMPGAIVSICQKIPVGWPDLVVGQMSHVSWHGIAHHDMIFPIFLFLAGVSFPFSYAKQLAAGKSIFYMLYKIIKRAVILVLLGIFISNIGNENISAFDFKNLRFASVLGHIGIAWAVAAVFFICSNFWTRLSFSILVLIAYWLMLGMVPAPDANPDPAFTGRSPMEKMQLLIKPNEQVQKNYSMEGCIVGYVDRTCLPGRLYKKIHDPEGILSIIPAVITALLGMMTGACIRRDDRSPVNKLIKLLLAGLLLIGLGVLWNTVFPFNKNLWSSSFVCLVGGISVLLFAIFYLVIDVWKLRFLGWPFAVIGMNSIAIYVAQTIVRFRLISDFFARQADQRLVDCAIPVMNAAVYVLVCWIFLWILYRNKAFLKV